VELKLDFDELVNLLLANGYSVEVKSQQAFKAKNNYRSAFFDGKNIRGGFCTPSYEVYRYINNRIAADHVDCFDKWSKCPLVMRLPVDGLELLKHLQYLGSPEGYQISNNYEYFDKNPWPCEVAD